MQLSTEKSINGTYLNIAIYHTGALGDLLVSMAAIFEAIKLFPNSKFTIIGSPLWKELLLPINWPQINFFIEIIDKNYSKIKLWKSDSVANHWNEIEIKENSFRKILSKFDITIDLKSESIRFALMAFFSKVPIRVGANKSKLASFLFTNFSIRKTNFEIHERDRYLNILLSLNKKYIEERKKYWHKLGLPNLKYNFNNEKSHESNINKKVILINPTASIREKAWSSQNFRELALKLINNENEIKIIGALNETHWLKEVAQNDFQIIQPNSISHLIDIVKDAKLLITNTSSMQFIAASTHTPTLTIMGTASPERWGPLGEGSLYVKNTEFKKNLPYFYLNKKNINKINEFNAYNSISINLVFEAAKKLII